MKEQIKAKLSTMGTFLGVLGGILVISLLGFIFVVGALLFGTGLQHDHEKKLKQERIQFLRDSLQVEVLKKQINEQKN